ncbi:hypothetical protein AUF62_03320, partial [archaeon 13_1_20CM_52_20]
MRLTKQALSKFVSDPISISSTRLLLSILTFCFGCKLFSPVKKFVQRKFSTTADFFLTGKIYQRDRLLCKQFLNTSRALLAIHPKKIREKEKSTPEMFGPHLTLDLSECNSEKLSDLSYIYDLLDELPDVIDMHKITAPYVFVYKPKGNPTEWGISGFVIIAESHISIHTFPDNKHAFMDIFSCKQFDIHKAVN